MPIAFLHPRYLSTHIGLFLLWLIAKLPQTCQFKLGCWLGSVLYRLWFSRCRIVKINLAWCFPHQTKQQIAQLAKQHFQAVGIGIFELANCFYLSDKKLKKRYRLLGAKILKTAQKNKKPVILLIGHFTTMLIAGRMLNQNFPIADVYFKQKNKLFEWKMRTLFEKYGAQMIDNQDMRKMVAAVRKGLPLWYAPDQDYGRKISVFAPFFSVQTATTTATARLAKMTHALVLPFSYTRRGNIYELQIHPALKHYPSHDSVADASLTNHVLEMQIKQAPEQYLWLHKRFKTRPNNEKSPY